MITPAPVMSVSAPVVAEKDASTWVEVRRSHGHQYETLVIKLNNRLYRIPDERIWTDGNKNDKSYYFNDYVNRENGDDGDALHDFEMSPDKKWLYVSRVFYHGLGVAYLFHFTGKGFVRVHPQGWRFDEAALRHFGRNLHFSVPGLDAPVGETGGSRHVDFDHWTPSSSGFVFTLIECGYARSQRDEKFISITAYYDVRSQRFKALTVDDERQSAARDSHKALQAIRAQYAAVNRQAWTDTRVENDLDGYSAEGGTLTGCFHGPSLRKAVATYYGETGNSIEEYYFRNGGLFFVVRTNRFYDQPLGSHVFASLPGTVVRTEQARFYFSGGRLIGHVGGGWERSGLKGEGVGQQGKDLLQTAREFLSQIHSPLSRSKHRGKGR